MKAGVSSVMQQGYYLGGGKVCVGKVGAEAGCGLGVVVSVALGGQLEDQIHQCSASALGLRVNKSVCPL